MWEGEDECHLRRRDHHVEVQVSKPETGLNANKEPAKRRWIAGKFEELGSIAILHKKEPPNLWQLEAGETSRIRSKCVDLRDRSPL